MAAESALRVSRNSLVRLKEAAEMATMAKAPDETASDEKASEAAASVEASLQPSLKTFAQYSKLRRPA